MARMGSRARHRHALPAIVGLAAAGLAACSGAAAPPEPRPIRIVSAVSGGSPFNRTLATVYETQMPDLAPEVLKSGGVSDSLEILQHGEGDVGYSLANVAYAAFAGQLAGQSEPYSRLRAIALLQRAALHVLVGPQSAVRATEELRGHSVKFFGPGAAMAMTAEPLLPPFGLDAAQVGVPGSSVADSAAAELLAGRLGAVVVLGAPPTATVQPAMAGGARLLPVQGRRVERLLREYPFYSAMVIPAGTYPGLAEPVVTVGVNGVLVCRADLPDEVVYRLTRALYDGPTGVHPALAQWVEPSAGPATPIPLHAGAARYYRERELSP